MKNSWFFLLMLFAFCQIMSSVADIPRPRGVAISKAGAYDPTKDFRCIDGSKTVPFEYVNDDYCDCPDGSDEPGTSACANGRFHCTNAGHTPLNIVSSMVNDGICDCCDGTDEYEGIIACSNTCKELGKQAREEAEKMKLVIAEAVKVKADYIEQGRKAKEEKTARLQQLEADRVQIDAKRSDLEAKKNEAEIPEKEAKDKHETAWEDEKARRKAEREKSRAEEAFQELDTNNDNVCRCGTCEEMPTALESLCCVEVEVIERKALEERQPCICQHSGFKANCLNRDVIDVSIMEFVDIDGPIDDNEPIHELYRYIAYRRFARFIWRKLGKRNRRVLPSCVVSTIRQTFPSEHYSGFKYPRP